MPYSISRYGSILTLVMPCWLTAPSHYLNQCWLLKSLVRSCGIHLRAISQWVPYLLFRMISLKIKSTAISPKGQWVKTTVTISLIYRLFLFCCFFPFSNLLDFNVFKFKRWIPSETPLGKLGLLLAGFCGRRQKSPVHAVFAVTSPKKNK